MKTRILLLRHGQSVANVEKFFSGQTDVPLTELGIRQAELAAEGLKDEKIDAVLSSPLSRAYKTALPIAKARGLEVITKDGLIEWYAGKWEGMHFDSIRETYPEEHSYWKNDICHLNMPGGESAYQVRERMGKALEAIAAEYEGMTVLAVCHGGVIKTVPSYFSGCDDGILNSTGVCGNCSVTEVVFEDGTGRVVRYSDDSHLGAFKSEAFVI